MRIQTNSLAIEKFSSISRMNNNDDLDSTHLSFIIKLCIRIEKYVAFLDSILNCEDN